MLKRCWVVSSPQPLLLWLHLVALVAMSWASIERDPEEEGACPGECFCDEATPFVSCVGDGVWGGVPKGGNGGNSDFLSRATRLELRNYVIGTLGPETFFQQAPAPSPSAEDEAFGPPAAAATTTVPIHIKELRLQQNAIEHVANGTFAAFQNLERLDLSQNAIRELGAKGSTFEGASTTTLRQLDLSSNRLQGDLAGVFDGLEALERLDLSDNRLTALSAQTFEGLHRIQHLNLDANRIAAVDVATFQYLSNLAHLVLSNNPLATAVATSAEILFLVGATRLRFVDTSHTQLQRVPQGLARYVRDLRLAGNNLTRVARGDLDGYPYLTLLVLDDNLLEEVEGDALGRQEFLARLWLNGNRLRKVPSDLPPSLKVLHMEENLIGEEAEEQAAAAASSEGLLLSNVQGALRAHSFRGLHALEQLFLQRNRIARLERCSFCGLRALRHLDLQANLLETISDGAFEGLGKLLRLDLSQNPLRTIAPKGFGGLEALRMLQMSRVKVEVVVASNGSNRPEDHHVTRSPLPMATTADLGPVFDPLKRLEMLEVYDSPSLASSLLRSRRALQGLRGLKEIDLTRNALKSLPVDFPSLLPRLRTVKLGGNAWICSSPEVLWLSRWIREKGFLERDISCSEPKELLHRPIVTLSEEDFPSTSTSGSTGTAPVDFFDSSIGTHPPLPAQGTQRGIPEAAILESNGTLSRPLSTILPVGNETDGSPIMDTEAGNTLVKGQQQQLLPSIQPTVTRVQLPSMDQMASSTGPPKMPSMAQSKQDLRGNWTLEEEGTSTMTTAVISEGPHGTNRSLMTEGDPPTIKTTLTVDPAARPSSSSSSSANWTEEFDKEATGQNDRHVEVGVLLSQAPKNPEGLAEAACLAFGLGLLLLLGFGTSFFFLFVLRFQCSRRSRSSSLRQRRRKGLALDLGLGGGGGGGGGGGRGLLCHGLPSVLPSSTGSGISYSPQRDEVSIVTVSEGTVGLKTQTHQGLSNKLYFLMEQQQQSNNATKGPSSSTNQTTMEQQARDPRLLVAALPDPTLVDLLPSPPNSNTSSALLTPAETPTHPPPKKDHFLFSPTVNYH